MVRFTFPAGRFPLDSSSSWDRDSNGLIEVDISWSDSAGMVQPQSLRVTSLDGIPGAANDTNLATGWRVIRLDSTGATLEETISLMLRNGVSRLRVAVQDSAGNVAADTLLVAVPPGALHREIDLLYPPAWPQNRGVNLALTNDGRKGFAPFVQGKLAIFDPDGILPTRYVQGINNSGFAAQIFADPGSDLLYIAGGGQATSGFTVFNATTEVQVANVPVRGSTSSVKPLGSRVMTGQACTDGSVILYDKATLIEIGEVDVGAVPSGSVCANAARFAATSSGAVWATVTFNGVIRFDPQTLVVRQQLDIRPPVGDGDFGNSRSMALLNDRWLFVAKVREGLDEIDLVAGQVKHHPSSGTLSPVVREVALSPSGSLLFVTGSPDASGPDSDRAPLLFDVPGLRLRYAFPVRPGAIHDGVVFHRDGKRVYVMAEYKVDVYIVRPD